MTVTATPANPRPARWLVAVGCPLPALGVGGAEQLRMRSFVMSGYAKQLRLRGRMRVPR